MSLSFYPRGEFCNRNPAWHSITALGYFDAFQTIVVRQTFCNEEPWWTTLLLLATSITSRVLKYSTEHWSSKKFDSHSPSSRPAWHCVVSSGVDGPSLQLSIAQDSSEDCQTPRYDRSGSNWPSTAIGYAAAAVWPARRLTATKVVKMTIWSSLASSVVCRLIRLWMSARWDSDLCVSAPADKLHPPGLWSVRCRSSVDSNPRILPSGPLSLFCLIDVSRSSWLPQGSLRVDDSPRVRVLRGVWSFYMWVVLTGNWLSNPRSRLLAAPAKVYIGFESTEPVWWCTAIQEFRWYSVTLLTLNDCLALRIAI